MVVAKVRHIQRNRGRPGGSNSGPDTPFCPLPPHTESQKLPLLDSLKVWVSRVPYMLQSKEKEGQKV